MEEPRQPESAEERKSKELHTQSLEEHMIEKTQPIDIKGAIEKNLVKKRKILFLHNKVSRCSFKVTSSIEVEEVEEAPTKNFI